MKEEDRAQRPDGSRHRRGHLAHDRRCCGQSVPGHRVRQNADDRHHGLSRGPRHDGRRGHRYDPGHDLAPGRLLHAGCSSVMDDIALDYNGQNSAERIRSTPAGVLLHSGQILQAQSLKPR